jgi:HAMP domain-containing protein
MASPGSDAATTSRPEASAPPLRPWQRLSVRLAAFFAVVTFLAVGAIGLLTYTRQQREVEDTVGTQLLNIARVAALQLDPKLHAQVDATRSTDSAAYQKLRQTLAAIQDETLLTSPITTLTRLVPAARAARLVIASSGPGRPGDPYPLAPELVEPMGWTLGDGVARYTRVYRSQGGLWISAFAPIIDAPGHVAALLHVTYPVEIYLDRLHELRNTLLFATGVGALATLVLGLLVLRRLTRPIALLTGGVSRVAAGDLSTPLPVASRDEVGRLTQAFNGMLDGLRQRDFIRSAFGRYVSPEVAQAILESPEGLRFGGTKRIVTVLMSDLRGYTRFAEQGDPEQVMRSSTATWREWPTS